MAKMTFGSITEAFLQMEDELDLFNQQVDGVYFWERIRSTKEILMKNGDHDRG